MSVDLLAILKQLQANRRAMEDESLQILPARCFKCKARIGWLFRDSTPPVCDDCLIAEAIEAVATGKHE